MRAILLFTLTILLGCAASRPPDAQSFTELRENKPGYAKLYIYRPHNDVGRGVWPEVFFNDAKIVGLKNEAYTALFVMPGTYKIRTKAGSLISGIQNVPGEITIQNTGDFFLKFDQSYNQFTDRAGPYGTPSPSFTTNYERWILIPREAAIPEISKCYFIPPYIPSTAP